MGEPEVEAEHREEAKEVANSGEKRKLDAFELAKQKAQEIASRIANDAAAAAASDTKRPRFNSSPDPPSSLFSNSSSAPPSYPVSYGSQSSYGSKGASKRISIPNGKVGVVIGKGGETIKYIQHQSGAKIQVAKDHDSDPHALTRDVELMGTSEQVNRAEELINDVIAEADTGGSASNAGHGTNTKQPGADQFSMKVPNDKVGLLIGKGGETIKYMQNRSGARIQIIPLHLPPGDPTTERTVYINGSTEQIEAAKELVNDVISGKRILNTSGSGSYGQPGYPPASNWSQPVQNAMQQQSQYGYAQPGNQPAMASYYGNFAQQPAWDQTNPAGMSQTPQQIPGYGYYGQEGSGYGYNQTPPAGGAYDQNYGQTPTQDQQISYPASTYGTTPVVASSVSAQAASAYPPAYNQSAADPNAYWTSANYAGHAPPHAGYDQTGYSQTGYGAPPSSTQPVYGQGGYPVQPPAAPANYGYEQPQHETQPPAQPSNNGHSHSSAYEAETQDGNTNASNGSNPAADEAVPSQS